MTRIRMDQYYSAMLTNTENCEWTFIDKNNIIYEALASWYRTDMTIMHDRFLLIFPIYAPR